MKKGKSDNKALFIDGSKEYKKITNNNKLEKSNVENILNAFVESDD